MTETQRNRHWTRRFAHPGGAPGAGSGWSREARSSPDGPGFPTRTARPGAVSCEATPSPAHRSTRPAGRGSGRDWRPPPWPARTARSHRRRHRARPPHWRAGWRSPFRCGHALRCSARGSRVRLPQASSGRRPPGQGGFAGCGASIRGNRGSGNRFPGTPRCRGPRWVRSESPRPPEPLPPPGDRRRACPAPRSSADPPRSAAPSRGRPASPAPESTRGEVPAPPSRIASHPSDRPARRGHECLAPRPSRVPASGQFTSGGWHDPEPLLVS